MILAGAVLVIIGSLIVAVGRAGRRGMLTPDAKVGIRTATTTASDEAWYTAHEVAGRWISFGGWAITIGGLIIMLSQPETGDAIRIALVATVVGAGLIVFSAFVGNRAASELPDAGE